MTAVWSQIVDKYHGIAPKQVVNAIAEAARKTGADFSFLMEKASAESSFDTQSKSKTSTATGLYQFIESTWLKVVKDHGAKYGLGHIADKIQIKDGQPCVEDCLTRKAILNLRKNPEIAALMAGEFSAENKQYLKNHTNKEVGSTELYFAHFMGATGASKFLNTREKQGDAVGAELFPKEARANKNVFFDPATGKARTLNEIYGFFAQKFDKSAPVTAVASAAPMSFSSFSSSDVVKIFTSFMGGDSQQNMPLSRLSAENILMMAQMHMTDLMTSVEKHPA